MPPLIILLFALFRHAKYASFMRQVNGWGFKRIVSGNDHNSYYHEYFVQENPQLCLKMMRIKKKTESSKAKKGGGDSDDDDESKAGTEDDASLARPPAQTGSAASSSVPAQITASQMPMFQSQDILIGGQQQNQSPGLLAALQNMQQGAAGVSAFQSPAFPGNNPTNHLAGLASSMGMPGLQNADAQWILTAGLLGGGSAGNIGGPNNNMVAPGLNALAGLGQAPNAVLGGGIQQQDLRQAGQLASGSAPGPLGDLTGIDPALLAKLQEAIQQQQQQQQQSQAPLPPASSHPVDNSLSAGADLGQQLPVGDQLVAGQDVVAPQLQQAAAATLSATDANAGDDEDGDEYGDDDGGSDDSGSDYASSGSEKD